MNELNPLDNVKEETAAAEDSLNLPKESKTASSSEHYHRHHRRHHRHKLTVKQKLNRFIKKNKVVITVAAGFLLVFGFMAVVYMEKSGQIYQPTEPDNGASVQENASDSNNVLYIGAPVMSQELSLLNDAAKEYVKADVSVQINEIHEKYEDTIDRMDAGKPVHFKFNVNKLPVDMSIRSAQLELAEGEDFQNSVFYDLDYDYNAFIYNLKSGTTYSYRGIFTLSNGSIVTHGGTFKTEDGTRMMNIDGIFNVRDIGGWKTVDGFKVKQGLLYRGTELDSAVEESYKITEQGVNELVLNLGIKTDMDLRAAEDRMRGRYVLGTNVTHNYYDAVMYDGIFTEDGKEVIADIFRDLAKEQNYPIYLHCTYGCDRTGTVCYVLSALLGVSENDLIKDYELSGLFSPEIDRANIQTIYSGLQAYSGFSIKEKTENYLISTGVTAEEIANIRRILAEQ